MRARQINTNYSDFICCKKQKINQIRQKWISTSVIYVISKFAIQTITKEFSILIGM